MSGDGGRAGRDTDVSGAEAVASKGKYTTYSEKKIKDVKKKAFIESGADKIDRMGGPPSLQVMKGPFQAGSIKTRTFFDEKVLASSKAKKNIGYTKTEFEALSLTEQNKVYDKYMQSRLSGQTDAYGNRLMTGDEDRGGQKRTEAQLEAENVAAQKAAQAEADQAAAEQADAYKKKRLSITSSRSLFARPGGRGFFY